MIGRQYPQMTKFEKSVTALAVVVILLIIAAIGGFHSGTSDIIGYIILGLGALLIIFG
jgi:hypothetical protein